MTNHSSSSKGPQVAYLGPPASFSHQASLGVFPPDAPDASATLNATPSFAEIFAAVQSSQARPDPSNVTYGVVPVENSSNGSVVQLLDLLADHEGRHADVKVCAEYYLPVHHCLLVFRQSNGINSSPPTPGKFLAISKLYTHPQVWGQCNRFLAAHLN